MNMIRNNSQTMIRATTTTTTTILSTIVFVVLFAIAIMNHNGDYYSPVDAFVITRQQHHQTAATRSHLPFNTIDIQKASRIVKNNLSAVSKEQQDHDINEDIGTFNPTSIPLERSNKNVLVKSIIPVIALSMAYIPTNTYAAMDVIGLELSPAVNSALLAYGHYFFILLGTILLCYERFTIQPAMSIETEKSLVIADAMYGIVGAFLFGTGYYRIVSEYGKGWEYYSHEPIFWIKVSAAGLLAGLSLFPTITFIKRGSKLYQNIDIEPMSDALAKRVQKVLNAELSAILSIPLLATLMARGVGYNSEFPWQLGAGFATITLIGSGVVYAKQALDWTEES